MKARYFAHFVEKFDLTRSELKLRAVPVLAYFGLAQIQYEHFAQDIQQASNENFFGMIEQKKLD